MLVLRRLLQGHMLLLMLVLPGAVGHADIYVWTDENGTVHMQNYGKPQDVVVYYTYPEKKSDTSQKDKTATHSLQQILGPKNPAQNSGAQTNNLDKLLKQHLEKRQNTDDRIFELYNRYNRLNQLLKSTDNTSKQ